MSSPKKRFLLSILTAASLPVLAETPAFTLSPNPVSNTYTGTITLQITGLSHGESVVVQKYVDANSNGIIDTGDFLVQQFNLTDGQASVFSGVTNRNVPGDTDVLPGQITAVFDFNTGAIGQNIVAQYGYVVSSPSNNFTAVTNFFLITNAAFSQSFTGKVVNSGTNVPDAVILLFQPVGNDLDLIASTIADNTGHYTVSVPVGTYTLAPVKYGFVTDLSAAPSLLLSSGASLSANLSLENATLTISGSVVDANNSSFGLPGLFASMQSTNNLLSIFFTDTNGNFLGCVTGDNQWKVGPDEASLPFLGYFQPQDKPRVNINSASVSGVVVTATKATALFYGSVTDGSGNPLASVSMNAFDQNNQYNLNVSTDQNGKYFAGVVGGLGSDTWQITVDTANSPAFGDYIFSQSLLQQDGGTNLAVGAAALQNFTGLPAPYQITGTLTSNGVSGIGGVGISGFATINGVIFGSSVDTDGSGHYSLPVSSGSWSVSVNCNSGNDTLANAGQYQCPGSQTVNITTAGQSTNFVAQTFDTFLSGKVQDNLGNPITFMNVFAFTGGGGAYFQATTDSSGNFQMGIVGGSYTLGLNNDLNSGFPSLNLVGPSIPVTVTDGVNINNFVLVAPQVTGQINVQVYNTNNLGIPGIGVSASLIIGNTNYVTFGGEQPTDSSGFISLPVFDGTWQVQLNGNDLQNAGYSAVLSRNVLVDNNAVPGIFTVTSLPRPVLSLPVWHPGQFQMLLTGNSGQNYTLQVSTNLITWSSLYATNNNLANSFLLTDTAATNPSRFYRILVGP